MNIIQDIQMHEKPTATDDSALSLRCLIDDMLALAGRFDSFRLALEIEWQKQSVNPERRTPDIHRDPTPTPAQAGAQPERTPPWPHS
jgi:hypothetical protein